MRQAKFTERDERLALNVLRVVGYVNLIALISVLLSIKEAVLLPLVVLTPLVALIGSAFYYLAWDRVVTNVSKADGRSYMRPYLIGFYLLVAVIALMLVLTLISGRRVT